MKKLFPSLPVLFVDDEADALSSYRMSCRYDGIDNIILSQDSATVVQLLSEQQVSVVALDLGMPKVTGQELLKHITENYPDTPVIIISAVTEVDQAVACMKQGAFDYIVKPVDRNRFSLAINRAIEMRELRQEVKQLSNNIAQDKLENPEAFAGIVTNNASMKSIFKYIESIVKSTKPILIIGESGTGKEAIARSIYSMGECEGSFVALNVAGLDDTLFSDTLFGHQRGAFSGAEGNRSGLLKAADKGYLFLDEIGDLSPASQVKLLRLLQEREFFPLGSDVSQRSSASIIAATNMNLQNLVKENKFRKDLYYRLSIHQITLPPLRERLDDIPLLIEHFGQEISATMGKPIPNCSSGIYSLLGTYSFPGNIRELQSMVYDAIARNDFSIDYFKSYIRQHQSIEERAAPAHFIGEELPTIKEMELQLLKKALEKSGNNQSLAAKMLGISQSSISRKIQELQDQEGK